MKDWNKEIGKKYGMLTIKELLTGERSRKYAICDCECGKETIVRYDHIVREGQATISCGCYKAKNLTSAHTGSEHPYYTGTYTEQQRKRRTTEYREWRKSVFERDSYTCQNEECNHTCHTLNAHHIMPYVEIYEDDEMLYNIDNGITYCEDCHRELHKRKL